MIRNLNELYHHSSLWFALQQQIRACCTCMFIVLERPQQISISLCVILHAGAGKLRSMQQLRRMLFSTVHNDKPQVAPVAHPPAHSSFITWLCLFSPCGLFSDWMNWKGWRFDLNNTSDSHNPAPHFQKASQPPLSFMQPIVSSAERLSPSCGCFWQKTKARSESDFLYVRMIQLSMLILLIALYFWTADPAGLDEIITIIIFNTQNWSYTLCPCVCFNNTGSVWLLPS